MCGMKSRGNWRVGICLKKCINRGELCKSCFRFNKFKPLKEGNNEKK